MFFFFFFQAEDGIRDLTVTGVQTCALPISRGDLLWPRSSAFARGSRPHVGGAGVADSLRGALPAVGVGHPFLRSRSAGPAHQRRVSIPSVIVRVLERAARDRKSVV